MKNIIGAFSLLLCLLFLGCGSKSEQPEGAGSENEKKTSVQDLKKSEEELNSAVASKYSGDLLRCQQEDGSCWESSYTSSNETDPRLEMMQKARELCTGVVLESQCDQKLMVGLCLLQTEFLGSALDQILYINAADQEHAQAVCMKAGGSYLSVQEEAARKIFIHAQAKAAGKVVARIFKRTMDESKKADH